MKKYDNRKTNISSKLHMIYISSNNVRHSVLKTFTTLLPTTLHATSLHLSTCHFLSFKLHPTTFHYPLIWLNPTWHGWEGRFLITDPRDHLQISLCRIYSEENSEEITVYATASVLHCWLPFHRGRMEQILRVLLNYAVFTQQTNIGCKLLQLVN